MRAAAYRVARQDATRRGSAASRGDRRDGRYRLARPGIVWTDGLFVRANRRSDQHAVEDVHPQIRGHHNLESYLHEYRDGAGLASDPKSLLFQTYSRATGRLTGNPLPQAHASLAALIGERRLCHTIETSTRSGLARIFKRRLLRATCSSPRREPCDAFGLSSSAMSREFEIATRWV
jgi:hypothetical protein